MTGIVTRTGTLTITEWNTEQTSDTCLHVARSEDTWRNIFSSISGGRWARLVVDMIRGLPLVWLEGDNSSGTAR